MNAWIRAGKIAAASIAMWRSHPRLVVLPAVAAVAVTAMIAATAAIDPDPADGRTLAALFAAYVGGVFIVIVANAAMFACALSAIAGEPVSLAAGLAAAMRRAPALLGWSLVAATVGLLLCTLGAVGITAMEHSRGGGSTFARSAGIVLLLFLFGGLTMLRTGTYFVVPMIVAERCGLFAAFARSRAVRKARWPGSLAARSRFGLINIIALTPLMAIVLAHVIADTSFSDAELVRLLAAFLAYGAMVQIALSALGSVFLAAVYRYAVTGIAPAPYDGELFSTAFHAARSSVIGA